MVRQGSDIDHPCAKDVGYNWFKSSLYLVLVKREPMPMREVHIVFSVCQNVVL